MTQEKRERWGDGLYRRAGSEVWRARYLDHDGRRVDRSTRCKSRGDAELVRARWMTDAQRFRIEVPDARARRMLLQADRPVAEHLAEYAESCMHEGQAKRAVDQKRAHVLDFVRFAGVAKLAEIDRDALQAWLQSVKREGRSNRTVNHHRQSVAAFLSWCVEGGRMRDNPAGLVKKLNESKDRRRERRALTDEELARLFAVAEERGRLAWYACAYYAGLRRGDLLRLEWRDIDFRGGYLSIRGGKSGRVDEVPIMRELAPILEGLMRGRPATPAARVFPCGVSDEARREDFARAGIHERDEAGRVADLHSLRTTLGTNLARSGVAPQHARSMLRHVDIKTTMAHYTALRLSDTARAVEALRSVSFPTRAAVGAETATVGPMQGTATRGSLRPSPISSPIGRFEAARDGMSRHREPMSPDAQNHRENKAFAPILSEESRKRAKGIEPSTFSLEGCGGVSENGLKQAESEEGRATVTIFDGHAREVASLASALAALPPGTLAAIRSIVSALEVDADPRRASSDIRNHAGAIQAPAAQQFARGDIGENRNPTTYPKPAPTAPSGTAAGDSLSQE